MADNILEQIMDNGKKILDIDDVNGYSNNYGSVSFEGTNEDNELIVKNVDTFAGIGYKTSNVTTGEIFNSYPESDSLTSTNSSYYKNDNDNNKALKNYSHARNLGTVANDRQSESVLGQYNISTKYNTNNTYGTTSSSYSTLAATGDASYTTDYVANALLIIGDGSGTDNRHNLLTIRSSCSGDDGAGTMSFSGSVDVDGHLNVADYVYSPIVYTDTLCYTNGEQYEFTDNGTEETFKLFDNEDISNAKTLALSWVEEDTENNKAFYRNLETQEVYQIQSNIDSENGDVYTPVATSETIDIYDINYSVTNNLFLSGLKADYAEINAVSSVCVYDGILSDEFIEKYCIDATDYLKLTAIMKAQLNDESWSSHNIQCASLMDKAYNTLSLFGKDLNDYYFIYRHGENSPSPVTQGTSTDYCIPVEKNTKRLILSDIISRQIYCNSQNYSFDWSSKDLYINGTEIPKSQLCGSFYSADRDTSNHNWISDVFPELNFYTYYDSSVPTEIASDGSRIVSKWKNWYKEIKIGDVFGYSETDGWGELEFNSFYTPDMDLQTFLQYAFIYDLAKDPTSAAPRYSTLTNEEISYFATKEQIYEFIEQCEGSGSNLAVSSTEIDGFESTEYGYWINTDNLRTNMYQDYTITKTNGDEVPVLITPILSGGGFKFNIDTRSISSIFKTSNAIFSEYNITLSTDEDGNYVYNNGDIQYSKATVSSPITYKGLGTRYLSQINTGNKTVTALSLSDSTGSSILSLLGSEGVIEVDEITWTNLLDALNQNESIDILGNNLIKLKTALSNTLTSGTYGITIGDDGSISLTAI